MASLIRVLDIYNDVAVATGFPLYTNDTDTPDITRFLLNTISHAVGNTIDSLYINNNALERKLAIVTNEGEDMYAINGLIKHIDYVDDRGVVRQIKYNNRTDYMATTVDDEEHRGEPRTYTISRGYIRLNPIPDKEYKINVTVSTIDLVLSDNDVFRSTITDINDSVIATQELANVITLRAISLILLRCQNPAAQIYADLANQRTKTFIENDYGSREAKRGFSRRVGHYDPEKGLLD